MHEEEPWLAPGLNLSVLPAACGTQSCGCQGSCPLVMYLQLLYKIQIPSRTARREQSNGLLLAQGGLDTTSLVSLSILSLHPSVLLEPEQVGATLCCLLLQ